MHDELLQFQRKDVYTLVPRLEDEHIIDTKWIFHNKTDEEGNVIRNKARLVAQGYSQMERVDYDETFTSVTRMKSIRVCARYQANPKESHMIALKRIIKYVKTIADFGVLYNKDKNDVLPGYSDPAEAEYNIAGSYCTQLLWMQILLHDYGIYQEHLTIYCNNTSAINISKNLIQHSQTKHIEI